jgi:hypothetical protein
MNKFLWITTVGSLISGFILLPGILGANGASQPLGSPTAAAQAECNNCSHLNVLQIELRNALRLQQAFRNKIPELRAKGKDSSQSAFEAFAKGEAQRGLEEIPNYKGPKHVDYYPWGRWHSEDPSISKLTADSLCRMLDSSAKELKEAKEASACAGIAAALQAHENWHINFCTTIGFKPYEEMHAADRAQEEVEAYGAQIEVLRAEIKKLELPAAMSCGGWSGMVTYSRTTNEHSEKKYSDFPTYKDSETSGGSSSYQVEIMITGGSSDTKSSARLQATAIVTVASHSATGRHIVDSQGCSIHGPPVLKLDTTDSRDFSGSATQELLGSLSINEDGTYSLSFRSPRDVVAQGNLTNISSSTGWCDPEKEKKANGSRNVPITEQVRFPDSSSGIGIKSRVDPSRPGTLEGTWSPLKEYKGTKTIITWDIQRPVSPERKATPRRPR